MFGTEGYKQDKGLSPRTGNSAKRDSWLVAHSKNIGEQNLLLIRLKEIDKQRVRSLHQLEIDRRYVKRDHDRLMIERRSVAASSVALNWMNHDPALTPTGSRNWEGYHPQNRTAELDRPRETPGDHERKSNPHCGLSSPFVISDRLHDSPSVPPISTTDCFATPVVISGHELINPDIKRDLRNPNADVGKDVLNRRRHSLHHDMMDRSVQERITRYRTLSRVPVEFDIRAKTAGTTRSGRPLISFNSFTDCKSPSAKITNRSSRGRPNRKSPSTNAHHVEVTSESINDKPNLSTRSPNRHLRNHGNSSALDSTMQPSGLSKSNGSASENDPGPKAGPKLAPGLEHRDNSPARGSLQRLGRKGPRSVWSSSIEHYKE